MLYLIVLKAVSKLIVVINSMKYSVLGSILSALIIGFITPAAPLNQLNTADQRSQWERNFSEIFIIPVLKVN